MGRQCRRDRDALPAVLYGVPECPPRYLRPRPGISGAMWAAVTALILLPPIAMALLGRRSRNRDESNDRREIVDPLVPTDIGPRSP
jgi:hypothetical protein